MNPTFFFEKKILIKGFLGPLGAPKKLKILVNEINRVMCICQGIFQEQIQADKFKLELMPLLPSDRPHIKEKYEYSQQLRLRIWGQYLYRQLSWLVEV